MSALIRSAFAAVFIASVTSVTLAQEAPAAKDKAPASKSATSSAVRDEVIATVNDIPIYKSEILGQFARIRPDPGREQELYDKLLDILINTKLLSSFLKDQRIAVSDKEIETELDGVRSAMKQQNQDFMTELSREGRTLQQLKSELGMRIQWKKYVQQRATEAELKNYYAKNKETLDGTQVRASHILLVVDPDAPAADKEKAKTKLLEIKKDIESGKIAFPDAANKYSEDTSTKSTPDGGDLGYFPRKGRYEETFSAAAFALKKGAVSDPVETPYGFHLIQVTDRAPGKEIDFNQAKDAILNQYGYDLQLEIVGNQKKTAKIDRKPMPADLLLSPTGTATGAAGSSDREKGAAPDTANPKK
jgi:peptidyl-prolyl cis-trans isomerase C